MHEDRVTVSVVLDPAFAERILPLAIDGPVWVTQSAINRAVVESYWKTAPPNAHTVTYWSEPRTGSTEQEWLGILDDLELHHSEDWAGPGIAQLRVFGAALSPAAEAALREFGYSDARTTPDGFVASRDTPPN
jgi:hypothetical protein